jgi:hypothetical protein
MVLDYQTIYSSCFVFYGVKQCVHEICTGSNFLFVGDNYLTIGAR